MKRTHNYAKSVGIARCEVAPGREIELPVFPGILKHPTTEQLRELLRRPSVACKYTDEALRIAAWQILREFPPEWLEERIDHAGLRPGRAAALRFLLSAVQGSSWSSVAP